MEEEHHVGVQQREAPAARQQVGAVARTNREGACTDTNPPVAVDVQGQAVIVQVNVQHHVWATGAQWLRAQQELFLGLGVRLCPVQCAVCCAAGCGALGRLVLLGKCWLRWFSDVCNSERGEVVKTVRLVVFKILELLMASFQACHHQHIVTHELIVITQQPSVVHPHCGSKQQLAHSVAGTPPPVTWTTPCCRPQWQG